MVGWRKRQHVYAHTQSDSHSTYSDTHRLGTRYREFIGELMAITQHPSFAAFASTFKVLHTPHPSLHHQLIHYTFRELSVIVPCACSASRSIPAIIDVRYSSCMITNNREIKFVSISLIACVCACVMWEHRNGVLPGMTFSEQVLFLFSRPARRLFVHSRDCTP